jgi:hypothetical protein
MPENPASFFYSFFINGCNVHPATNQPQSLMCSLTQAKKTHSTDQLAQSQVVPSQRQYLKQ